MNEQIGFQVVDPTANLQGRMAASPTGRQLALDGSFVKPVYTQDPADILLSPPDGLEVTWNASGVIKDCKFTRETGWLYSAAYS